MKVGDLVRFRPELPWVKGDYVGILVGFKADNIWADVYWPRVDTGLLNVYLAKELEVISESR